MPIKISSALPAYATLTRENIFVMDEGRALSQDIRPLQIAIVNLMPTKIDTETQLLRLLGNTPLQVEITLVQMASHKSTHVSLAFYQTFEDIRSRTFDGMIITGAPVEQLPFEEVEYWQELSKLMEWSKKHVQSTFHICWGAQAGLYYHYGINKRPLEEKMFGIFTHTVEQQNSVLFRGMDDTFMAPHSRHTTVDRADIDACPELTVLAASKSAGVYAVSDKNGRQIFIFGHSEYDRNTLEKEYLRDKAQGLPIEVPKCYYPNDDDTQPPMMRWRSHAHLLYSNWLNYFVYQATPYNLSEIQ